MRRCTDKLPTRRTVVATTCQTIIPTAARVAQVLYIILAGFAIEQCILLAAHHVEVDDTAPDATRRLQDGDAQVALRPVRLPLTACSPDATDTSQCTPLALLLQSAAVSAVCSILGTAVYLGTCVLRRVRGLGERALMVLTGLAFFLTLCTLQGGIAMVAVAYFCDVFLQRYREFYARQQSLTMEQAAENVFLLSDHQLVWAAGLLGLVTAAVTLVDALARLGYPPGAPGGGDGAGAGRRAKTAVGNEGFDSAAGELSAAGGGYPSGIDMGGGFAARGGFGAGPPAPAEPAPPQPPSGNGDNPFFNQGRGGGTWPTDEGRF